jgi:hypothetical protein
MGVVQWSSSQELNLIVLMFGVCSNGGSIEL